MRDLLRSMPVPLSARWVRGIRRGRIIDAYRAEVKRK
jgi:hypothetical protein